MVIEWENSWEVNNEGLSTEEAAWMVKADSTEAITYAPTEDFHSVQLDEFIEETKQEARRLAASVSSKSKAVRIAEIQTNRKRENEVILQANTDTTLKTHGIQPEKEVTEEETDNMPLVQKMIHDALDKALKKEE